eukprot:3110486-Pyramimonas_sp.AAC.1
MSLPRGEWILLLLLLPLRPRHLALPCCAVEGRSRCGRPGMLPRAEWSGVVLFRPRRCCHVVRPVE